MYDIERRIERLLNQLEDPRLTGGDIEAIKLKLQLLYELRPPLIQQDQQS